MTSCDSGLTARLETTDSSAPEVGLSCAEMERALTQIQLNLDDTERYHDSEVAKTFPVLAKC